MTYDLATTRAPHLRSWLASANQPDSDFPIQNLPFGVFSDARNPAPRVGVAIGDVIIDLAALAQDNVIQLPRGDAAVFAQPSLNAFIALGREAWRSLRIRLSALLAQGNETLARHVQQHPQVFVAQSAAQLHLPITVAGYTDFYSSKEHARNVGALFRDPANPLPPNWLEMPIGYNGRASSVVVSGTPVRRPNGQIKLPGQERPIFTPSRKLDIELEMGFIVGQNSTLGEPIACGDAEHYIFGLVLLNDWSARDIQAWEYVPLGPFNAKTFATSISPWVVTLDALEPFRALPPPQDPEPLSYLCHNGDSSFDIDLAVHYRPHGATQRSTIARSNFKYLYWTMAQQLAHHTVSGCNLRVGDLMGSGTISGPSRDSYGSLLELTENGAQPLMLAEGVRRCFIEDGDELTLAGWCQGDGYRVGFGKCVGKIMPAPVVNSASLTCAQSL